MKTLFELLRRFDARRIFGLIRRLGGMSRPKVKRYDLRSTHALRVEGDYLESLEKNRAAKFLSTPSGWRATAKTDKVFICFCAKGRRICLFKTRKEKNLPVAF